MASREIHQYANLRSHRPGIQGGFAPPKPTAIHEIKYAADTGVTIDTHVRSAGAPTSTTVADTQHSAVDALVTELEGILAGLPQADERAADIYGRDVGIFFGSDALQWRNSASEGCGAAEPETPPTEAQKQQFRRAVEISEELVALGAAQGD